MRKCVFIPLGHKDKKADNATPIDAGTFEFIIF